jgi:hypothetical protein
MRPLKTGDRYGDVRDFRYARDTYRPHIENHIHAGNTAPLKIVNDYRPGVHT